MNELRLKLIARCADLVRAQITGKIYDGTSIPNIQSIIDLCFVDESKLQELDIQLTKLEQNLEGKKSG